MLRCEKCGDEMTYAEWPKRGLTLQKYCCGNERDRRTAKDFVQVGEQMIARCTYCHEMKPLDDFPKNGDRRRSQCKICWNKRIKEMRNGNNKC